MPAPFGKSTDKYFRIIATVLAVGGVGTVALIAYLAHPEVRETGYAPVQPVEYSHKLHAGNLGIDCRYCHYTVEKAGYAAVPQTEVCMNCHVRVKENSALLQPVRDSYATGKPIAWTKVHNLPDYVYFNHQAHVTAGVSCVSCHGRVDQMIVVKQVEPLSMAWCLECHRNPEAHVRPVSEVTNLGWTPDRDPVVIGRELIAAQGIKPPVECAGCHR